ncbi:hypothetical protein BGZ96_011357 [Linnemannia gamsii]|uniref:C2H2-type domain-containing protein n=1 Tax=Linnemannia gamsii TaxID=64522 RepID=A0ABQ7JSR0_9FUNG|nr:hypothetical protein BGZ96_011357 [Linnemannia gamsii]
MNAGNSNNINNANSMSGDADAAATGPAWDTNNARRHTSMPSIVEQSFFAGPNHHPQDPSSAAHSSMVDADGLPRKPHVCPWPNCNKTFTRSAHLTRHVRAHGGEKPYSCPHEGCGKRFSRSDVLKEHIRIHDGNRVRKRRVRGSSDSNSSSSHASTASSAAASAAAKRNSIAAASSLAATAEQSTAQLFAIPPPLTCRAPNGMGTMPNPAFPVSSFRSCEAQPSPDMQHPYAHHYPPQASLSPREPSLSSSPPYYGPDGSFVQGGAGATTMSIQPNSSFNALLGMESVAHFERSSPASSWHQQQQQITTQQHRGGSGGSAVVSGSYSATPYQQGASYPNSSTNSFTGMSHTTTQYPTSSSSLSSSNHSNSNQQQQPITLETMATVASMEADLIGLQQNWSPISQQQQQQQHQHHHQQQQHQPHHQHHHQQQQRYEPYQYYSSAM